MPISLSASILNEEAEAISRRLNRWNSLHVAFAIPYYLATISLFAGFIGLLMNNESLVVVLFTSLAVIVLLRPVVHTFSHMKNVYQVATAFQREEGFTLYLRSFENERGVWYNVYQYFLQIVRVTFIGAFYAFFTPKKRDVGVLVEAVAPRPFISVGDKKSRFGIPKLTTDDSNWRITARELMVRSELIIFVLSHTEGVRLEFDEVLKKHLDKTVFIMLDDVLSKMDREYQDGWESLVEDFADVVSLPQYYKAGLVFRLKIDKENSDALAVFSYGDCVERNIKAAIFDSKESNRVAKSE